MCVWEYLFEHDERHGSQGGEKSSDEDHDDANRDALIQTSQSGDPPAVGERGQQVLNLYP